MRAPTTAEMRAVLVIWHTARRRRKNYPSRKNIWAHEDAERAALRVASRLARREKI